MNPEISEVCVVDFKMSFFSMVKFMIKWTLAAVPAIFILFALLAFVTGLFGSFFTHL